MSDHPVIVWFRQDLRLGDNPALDHAVRTDRPVLAIYVLDEDSPGGWRPGGASRWWLHHSLDSLARDLAAIGLPLIFRRGPADLVVPSVVAEVGAAEVVWNRCYEPWAIDRDSRIKSALTADGVEVHSFNGSLLREPWTLKTAGGQPYRVFTPFHRALLAAGGWGDPLPAPERARPPERLPASDSLADLALLPTRPDWAGGLRDSWTPGERAARARLDRFLSTTWSGYAKGRDIPGTDGTSRLSPHLHFGEISPRQVWAAVASLPAGGRSGTGNPGGAATGDGFIREIIWREFCHGLLYHFPSMPDRPLNPRFEDFPWAEDQTVLGRWQRGRTGYPIVDAGMRQLWHTGWMHNRVRMIAGSLLVKHLLQPWQAGARWFWDTLVDADLANNSGGWQWIAGCGADAAPYFRVFNPMLQGAKFDPDGAYVRRWVPELARLPDAYIHAPWTAPADVLAAARVVLDHTYPRPIVEHDRGRDRALAAFAAIKDGGDPADARDQAKG